MIESRFMPLRKQQNGDGMKRHLGDTSTARTVAYSRRRRLNDVTESAAASAAEKVRLGERAFRLGNHHHLLPIHPQRTSVG